MNGGILKSAAATNELELQYRQVERTEVTTWICEPLFETVSSSDLQISEEFQCFLSMIEDGEFQ